MTLRTHRRRERTGTVLPVLGASALVLSLLAAVPGCASRSRPAPDWTPEPAQAPAADASKEPQGGAETMIVISSAFVDGGRIPAEYCMQGVPGGKNVSLPLSWTGAPAGTASFAVFVIDRHPVARDWVHWAVVDLPPAVTNLPAGASGSLQPPARELVNTYGSRGYGGPMPPPGTGDHPYEVTVYALDVERLEIADAPTAEEIARSVAGHVLAQATIAGVFSR